MLSNRRSQCVAANLSFNQFTQSRQSHPDHTLKLIGFYIVKVFAYLVSIVPLGVLYAIADLLYVLNRYLIRYRQEVIQANLRYAFPEKSDKELNEIANRHYRYFTQLLVETLKLYTMSARNVKRRVRILNPEVIHDFASNDQSIVLVMGHYGNWEFLGLAMSSTFERPIMCALYKPLKNHRFDKLLLKTRSRFGARLIPFKRALRDILSMRDTNTMTIFLADQKPRQQALDVTFMNRRTAAFPGAYKIADKLDVPIVYQVIRPVKRGYYEIEYRVLSDKGDGRSEEEKAQLFFTELERDIRRAPEYWLWSHRRWRRRGDEVTDIYTEASETL